MDEQFYDNLIAMTDALDHEILMHREAHFGGQFPIMLEYYRKGGKGANPDFTINRIEHLATLELQLNQNLAPLLLLGNEAEKIALVRQSYKDLKALYEVKNPKNRLPLLIADLILAEEEEPSKEIQAIVHEKAVIVPYLIELLRKEEFRDPLFPGYGQAPNLAVKCLGLIGDKRALFSLFESIGEGDFFSDDLVIRAFAEIGEPAKQFLLTVVKGHPITEDNERAAIALIAFKEDPAVAETCFHLLQDPNVKKDPCLPTYLVLACSGLKNPVHRQEFASWANNHALFSRPIREDIKAIFNDWDKSSAR